MQRAQRRERGQRSRPSADRRQQSGSQVIESLGGPPELLAATIDGAGKQELSEAAERLVLSFRSEIPTKRAWGATAYAA